MIENRVVSTVDFQGAEENLSSKIEEISAAIQSNSNFIYQVTVPIPINRPVISGSVRVLVSHIESINKFWIQLQEHNNIAEEMKTCIPLTLVNKHPGNRATFTVVEGNRYVVKHPDSGKDYYRVLVQKVHQGYAQAFFMDYGFTVWVSFASIRPYPQILEYVPVMAFECKFHNPICSINSVEKKKHFIALTEGKVCEAVFRDPLTEMGIQYVESLYANGVNIAEYL